MEENGINGLVSVIVPTYNRASHLKVALRSVKAQTYRPIEVIVVDDGSDDNTADVVKRWTSSGSQDDQFTVTYLNQENRGPSAARNFGLVHSRGEYIQFLDSDDYLHPQKVEVHVRALEHNPPCDYASSLHSTFQIESENPSFDHHSITDLLDQSRYVSEIELLGTSGNLWDGFYRRRLCAKAGPMHEDLSRMEDVEYNIRVSALKPAARHFDLDLVARGEHGDDQLTGVKYDERGLERGFASIRRIEKDLDFLNTGMDAAVRKTLSNFYLGLARLSLRLEKPKAFQRAVAGAKRNRRGVLFEAKVWTMVGLRKILDDHMLLSLWDKVAGFDT
jgi:glycosyltransferase involved in cell wall biosynthesis